MLGRISPLTLRFRVTKHSEVAEEQQKVPCGTEQDKPKPDKSSCYDERNRAKKRPEEGYFL